MAVVGTASRSLIIYQLENQPQEFRKFESPLKYQVTNYSLEVSSVNNWKLDHIFRRHLLLLLLKHT